MPSTKCHVKDQGCIKYKVPEDTVGRAKYQVPGCKVPRLYQVPCKVPRMVPSTK